jgi:hypothetical protein
MSFSGGKISNYSISKAGLMSSGFPRGVHCLRCDASDGSCADREVV